MFGALIRAQSSRLSDFPQDWRRMFRVAATRVANPMGFFAKRYSHIVGNQVRPGVAIELEGKLYRCVKSQSVKPGKGVAYMQAELKELTTGHKINRRFRASESVKKAPLTKDQTFQFLYMDGGKLVLMEPNTFEQVDLFLRGTQLMLAPYFCSSKLRRISCKSIRPQC